MKYFKNIFMASALVLAATSCVNDDVNYTTTDKPIVTVTGQTETTIEEGETITVTLNASKAYKEQLDLKLELVSGGSDEDYFVSDADGAAIGATSVDDGFGAFGYKLAIPAYETTASFNITAYKDYLPEGTENLRFKVVSSNNGNSKVLNDAQYINLNVENFVADQLGLKLEFDSEVNYVTIKEFVAGTEADDERINHTESLCGLVDFDIFASNFASYSFTGECPELVDPQSAPTDANIVIGTMADGTYDITVDHWANTFGLDADDVESLAGDFAMPVKVTIAHVGTFVTSFELPSTFSSADVVSDDVAGAGERVVATLEVTGGKYKVLDTNGVVIAAE